MQSAGSISVWLTSSFCKIYHQIVQTSNVHATYMSPVETHCNGQAAADTCIPTTLPQVWSYCYEEWYCLTQATSPFDLHYNCLYLLIRPRKAVQTLPWPTVFHVVQAGYWVKFSTSNNSTSDKPHWLLYRHCAKLTNSAVSATPILFDPRLAIKFHNFYNHNIQCMHVSDTSASLNYRFVLHTLVVMY